MEQRSSEWYRARLGHITASECSLLMKNHREPMTPEEIVAHKALNPKSRATLKEVPFSDATFTYLNAKVMENYLPLQSDDVLSRNIVDDFVEQHNYTSRAAEWGVMMEDEARNRYAELRGCQVEEVGFVPYDRFPKLVGGSPDGLVGDDGGIEIKCPFTLDKHMQHYLYVNYAQLRENEPEYYWQCVMNMMVTGRVWWDFVSYCPYVAASKQIKVLRIPRDECDMRSLEDRITLAVEYMRRMMEKIEMTPNII